MSASTWNLRSARGGGWRGAGRLLGRVEALDWLGREIGLGQQRSAQRQLLSQKRDVFPWLNRSWAVNAQLVTLPRGPDSRMSWHMNRRGGGGDAPLSLIAELDARPAPPSDQLG